jgi:hypothetical protein
MPDFDADFLKNLLFAVGGLIWTALGIKHLLRKPGAPVPQPFETKKAPIYATKYEHDQLADKVDCNCRATEDRFKEMALASSASRDKLYSSINALREETAEQRASLKHIQASLARQEVKLDNMSERKADKK